MDEVDPKAIRLDGWNARRECLEPDEELVESVRAHGILEPVGVRVEEGECWCVYGFRRVRAAILVGLEQVPVVLVEGSKFQAQVANIAENYQRRNLRPHELAQALFELHREYGFHAEELATMTGISKTHCANLLRVRQKLAPVIWEQFCSWGPTLKVPFQDLVELATLSWEEQIARWNTAHDLYGGARRGNEWKPGPAKLRKMLRRIEDNPEIMREGTGFAAGARYGLRVALGLEVWRHGGVVTSKTRRQRAKARKAKAGKGNQNGNEE